MTAAARINPTTEKNTVAALGPAQQQQRQRQELPQLPIVNLKCKFPRSKSHSDSIDNYLKGLKYESI